MPAKRSSRTSVARSGQASSSTLPPADDLGQPIKGALETWGSGGQDVLRDLVSQQLAADTMVTPLATLPLTNVFLNLLLSEVETEEITTFLVSVFDSISDENKEDHTEALAEALVDVVEVLEESEEDVAQQQAKERSKALGVLGSLITSGHIPTHVPNFLLSPDILQTLGLLPPGHNPTTFSRAQVKRNTTLFYKQSKYNLLRESSEGFSGLIVLLTSSDALAADPIAESSDARQRRASRVWEKIMGLIGYFNLSPPRVLDLILEVASCHVTAHWRFFLELLRCSPWGTTAQDSPPKGKGKAKADANWVDFEVDEVLHAMDGLGDRVLAQVLGVKFGFYQKPEGGDTPMGLVYMAALLLKHGFVGLTDLLPFLSPDDKEMEAIHQRYLSTISSRSGPSNALSNSVLLDDDDAGGGAGKETDDSGLPAKPPPEQKIMLLQALLAIGELPASLYFLSKFPWLAQSHPQIADLILRIVDRALVKIYRDATGGSADDECGLEQSSARRSTRSKEVVQTLLVPPPTDTASRTFRFFYPDWQEDLELWTTVEDLYEKGMRWLSLIRGLAARMVEVPVRICRLGVAYFAELQKQKEDHLGLPSGVRTKAELAQVEPTADEMQQWLDILRISILPALSASSCTAAFDFELWELLSFLPYTTRYALYGEWRDSTCNFRGRNPCPVAAHAAAEATRDIKKALSRVTASQSQPGAASTAAERAPARALAKLSHSNPCALWTTAVTQVKAYTNIGQFIVEAGRYMSPLALDVATFTLVDSLSDDTSSRLNANGTDVAQWLASIATFVGDFNRRYIQMDLGPILQFIMNRLMRGEAGDLTILEKLMSIMSGFSQVENDAISEDQLKAYAAGPEMIREAFHATSLSITRPADMVDGARPKAAPMDKNKATKKSLPRLVDALRNTGLAMPIWIALAQTRQSAVDKMADAPIKAMGAMQDTVHGTFIQYGELLSGQLSTDEHIELTPDLAQLVGDFGLGFPMAFNVLRPRLRAELACPRKFTAAETNLNIQHVSIADEEDPSSTPVPASPVVETATPAESPAIEKSDGDIVMTGSSHVNGRNIPAKAAAREWWPAALTPTMRQARELLSPDVNELTSAAFFVIFWQLTMDEIAFDSQSYSKAIAKITALDKDVSTWRMSDVGAQKAERARLQARAESLVRERTRQEGLVASVRRRLRNESPRWFPKFIAEKHLQRRLSHQLHQYCFFPRALLTPADAVFVAKFIRLAHDMGTNAFSTLFAYDSFFSDQLAGVIFSSTTNEARNLGRCLATIMADLDAWHRDEAVFRKEALGITTATPAGQTPKTLPGMLFRAKSGQSMKPMTWSQFRIFYSKCHANLSQALVSCWAESDFMHIKNAITVGLQVIKSFPRVATHGNAIESAVADLIAGKNGTLTPDLQHQCQAYLRNLKSRQQARPYITQSAFTVPAAGRGMAPNGASNGPSPHSRPPPTQPRSAPAAAGKTDPAKLNGTAEPIKKAPATDRELLRQKLEDAKNRNASMTATVPPAEDPKAALSARPRTLGQTSTENDPTEPASRPSPPAGPRSSRAPSGSSRTVTGRTSASPAPSRPSRGSPSPAPAGTPSAPLPGSTAMAPPAAGARSIEEDRRAARARKFGDVSRPVPPTGPAAANGHRNSENAAPAGNDTHIDTPTSSLAVPIEAASVLPARSGSVDSISERSRDKGEPRENGRSNSRAPSERKAPSEGGDRGDRKLDRRSSRDERRRETEKEREERKAKERERSRERGSRHDDAHKRKRDDEARRPDETRDRERDRDRENDRVRSRHDRDQRDRHGERGDDRRAHDSRRPELVAADDRHGERDRHRGDERRDRDARSSGRGGHGASREPPARPRSPARWTQPSVPPVPDRMPTDGHRTPERKGRELLPSRPESKGTGPDGRIVEAPRPTRQEAPPAGRHALPARPAGRGGGSAEPPARDSAQQNVSLASRIGGSAGPTRQTEQDSSADRDGRLPSKRPHDDAPGDAVSREGSPSGSKRVKIDRSKARGRGRDSSGGGGRMFADAMRPSE